jgi:hypothetical protein
LRTIPWPWPLIEVHPQARPSHRLRQVAFDDHVSADRGQRILRTTSIGTSPESCHWSHTLSVIPLRSSRQFDPMVPCCIVCLTASGTSAILLTPGRRRGTWSGSAATYVTCGSRSQRCSEIKPTALPSPSPGPFHISRRDPYPISWRRVQRAPAVCGAPGSDCRERPSPDQMGWH